MIELAGIRKAFSSRPVLQGVDLDVHDGEVLGVIGPSGSGKSTLLRCINGLVVPDAGTVTIARTLVTPGNSSRIRRVVGMVFQRFNLFPHLTVFENVAEGPRHVLRQSPSDSAAVARSLLERVGLSDKADAFPRTLSGGQQQRVAIARALAMEPKVMLFDEVTSALDPELVGEVISVMTDLADSGMTMVVVTHEMSFARRAANRIAMLAEGRIVEIAPAEQLLSSPQEARTQRFLSTLAG